MSVHWGGRGPFHCSRKTSITILVPTNSVAPVVTGTAAAGNTLSCSTGTWTNSPVSYSYQWYSNTTASTSGATLLAGETASTTLLTNAESGLYIFCEVRASAAGGGTSVWVASNIAGPVTGASGLTAPTLTKTSAAGAALEWSTQIPSSTYVGYYVQFISSADGLTDPAGAFTNPTQSISHFITNDDFVNGITHSKLLADGWRDFPGQNYVNAYFYTEGQQQASPLSNVISDNVTAPVATWDGYIGRNRCSTDITLSGTTNNAAAINTNVNSECGVCSTVPKPSGGKGRFEITINSIKTAIGAGVIDGTSTFTTTTNAPGSASAGAPYGSRIIVTAGSTAGSYSKNNTSSQSITLTSAPAVGDVIGVEFDETANKVYYCYHYGDARAADQTWSVVLTTHIPPAWYAYGSGKNSQAGLADSWTLNTGQSAFVCTQQLAGSSGW